MCYPDELGEGRRCASGLGQNPQHASVRPLDAAAHTSPFASCFGVLEGHGVAGKVAKVKEPEDF